ncbi:hypothetical protein RND81_10G078600 [Saponaria officinalis]|uniref:Uncharacterized protein n=1 Tax=Saponaria officinalis TaxID=3572 RepID=A0AAW1I223_SAPOF
MGDRHYQGQNIGNYYFYKDHENNPFYEDHSYFGQYPNSLLPNQFNWFNTKPPSSSTTTATDYAQRQVPSPPTATARRKATTKALRKAELPKMEAAVESASYELAATGQRVLAWKVAVLVLAKLHVPSWDAFGLYPHESPLFCRLIHAEAQYAKDSIGVFVEIWKQACLEYTPIEVFGNMLELQSIKLGAKNLYKSIFSAYPFVGFLNVAVLAIKMGIWDTSCNTFQFKGELGLHVDQSIRIFAITWKEACQKYSDKEVLQKMMEFYGVKNKNIQKLSAIFSAYPLVRFINVAVTSIKMGVWDILCSSGEQEGENNQADELTTPKSVDVEPIKKDHGLCNVGSLDSASCVDVVNIVHKVLDYLAENSVVSAGSSHLDKVLMFAKQLCSCKVWLAEQFSANEFESLGHGDLLSFLESNTSILQNELLNSLGR